MARSSRSSRRSRMNWLQVAIWLVTALVALSMVLALLPLTR